MPANPSPDLRRLLQSMKSAHERTMSRHDEDNDLATIRADQVREWIDELERALPAGEPVVPESWADAANSARGLCLSEANRWDRGHPKTAEHCLAGGKAPSPAPETCEWKQYRDKSEYYKTACGMVTGLLLPSEARFCFNCGRPLKEVPFNG